MSSRDFQAILSGVMMILITSSIAEHYYSQPLHTYEPPFENSLAGKGSSLVEIVSTCSSGWKLTPVKANEWMEENMFKYYQLGDLKDKQ